MIQLEHYHPEERWICLDFANTNEWHASAHPTEHLSTYADLVAWAAQIGVLPDEIAQTALAQAGAHPAAAQTVLGRARALREAIYRIVVAMIDDQPAADEDMATLNGARALGIADETGSIAPGKAADLCAVDLGGLDNRPCYDPVSHLVHVAGRESVSHVWVAGKCCVEDKKLAGFDRNYLESAIALWQNKLEVRR